MYSHFLASVQEPTKLIAVLVFKPVLSPEHTIELVGTEPVQLARTQLLPLCTYPLLQEATEQDPYPAPVASQDCVPVPLAMVQERVDPGVQAFATQVVPLK